MCNDPIKLSPLNRLSMTFDAELSLDKAGIFGLETYEKFLEMQGISEAKLERIIKSTLFTDALLFLVLNGHSWPIPGFGSPVSSIPAIQEILLFMSSLSFLFLCTTFITNQCYVAIISQFGNRIVDSNLIDPYFFTASRMHFDLFLKLFRSKLNIWGADFYQHNRGFEIFTSAINKIVFFITLVFPTMHLLLTVATSVHIWNADGVFFLSRCF